MASHLRAAQLLRAPRAARLTGGAPALGGRDLAPPRARAFSASPASPSRSAARAAAPLAVRIDRGGQGAPLVTVETPFLPGRPLSLEVGRVAPLAASAVLVRAGDAALLAALTVGAAPSPGSPLPDDLGVPLMVE
jgi:hypothetical protein